MSKIGDFATQQEAFNVQLDAGITDIATEIKTLNDTIAALQASSGAITPEDQALLDTATAHSQSLVAKVTALDTLTPPVVPAPEPVPAPVPAA